MSGTLTGDDTKAGAINMSDRANWVLVENGKAMNYYHRWGDVAFPFKLLLGPDQFVVRAKQEPDGVYPYLIPMAQSDVLLDTDKRLLLYWTWMGRSEGALMLTFARVVADHWPGWIVRYDFRGRRAITDHLGWPLAAEDEDGEYPTPEHAATAQETARWLKTESQTSLGEMRLLYKRPLRRLMHDAAQRLRSTAA